MNEVDKSELHTLIYQGLRVYKLHFAKSQTSVSKVTSLTEDQK